VRGRESIHIIFYIKFSCAVQKFRSHPYTRNAHAAQGDVDVAVGVAVSVSVDCAGDSCRSLACL